MNVQPGLIGKKIGMTQIFAEDGARVPVTVLLVTGNVVLGHRTLERDGYTALQVGFDDKKPSRVNKPELGQFKAASTGPKYCIKEFRVPANKLGEHPIGSELPIAMFQNGTLVDVTGTSKGKGFQGVMKRHNMRGEGRTHGSHEVFRHGGSIGCRKTPGRVMPGKRMPGRMGQDRVTQQNMTIARVLPEEGVLLVRGPIPGGQNSYVTVRHAVKPAIRAGANRLDS